MKLFKRNKNQTESGTALWINEFGTITPRVFKVIGKEDKDKRKYLILDFGNNERIKVRADFIRAKRLIIYKDSNGKVIAQNPNDWRKINLEKKGIKVLRFNLQNMGIQEGRAAIHRWTLPETLIKKLTPLFKLLLICIVVGVIGYVAFKEGSLVLNNINSARLMNCNNVIPNIVNVTLGK